MRRGYVFTLDALLSLLLVSIFVTSIVIIESNTEVYSTYFREQDKYVAEDTLTTLRTVSLRDLVPQERIEEWKSGSDPLLLSELVNEDMSPLEIVATYWATDPLYPSKNLTHKAEVILGYVLNRTLKDYNYELLINNYTSPYLRKVGSDYSKAKDVSPATLVLSGYAYNQTPRGYMARAYLTKVETIRKELYGWMRVSAGSDNGINELTISRNITLPSDANILSADGKFVSRQGERITLYINGKFVDWEYGEINRDDLASYLSGGENNIKLVFSYGGILWGSEIGSASGTTLYIKYETSSLSVEDLDTIKVYDVTSKRTGFMYLFENFVPGNITSISMRFKVRNVGKVRLYYGFGGDLTLLYTKNGNTNGDAIVEFTDSEIRTALNNLGVSYDDLSKMVFDFVVGFDAYYSGGYWYYEGDTYNDGANRQRMLYGYPNSYLRINYVSKTVTTQYSIPLSIYFPYGDSRVTYNGRGLQVTYDLPQNSTPWYADFWVGYTFSGSTTQELWENNQKFYSGPLGRYAIRVAYTKLYDWMMVPGQTNNFEIKMVGGGSYVRNGDTRGIIKYFIQGYVGYGDVFPKLLQGYPIYKGYNLTYWYSDGENTYERQILVGESPYSNITVDSLDPTTYAVDDAILRLFNRLNYENDANPNEWTSIPYDGSLTNPIDVNLTSGIQMSFANMGNIPKLFEPITITLRVWREE